MNRLITRKQPAIASAPNTPRETAKFINQHASIPALLVATQLLDVKKSEIH